MVKILLISFFFTSSLVWTQKKKFTKFDSIFEEAIKGSSGRDAKEVLILADSLYAVSQNEIQKVKALMLSANTNSNQLNTMKAIEYAEKANSIAEQEGDYQWQSRIAGFLSNQFRLAGLLKEGRIYLEKGMHASKELQDPHESIVFQALVYKESAKYNVAENQLDKAIKDLKKSIILFNKINRNKHYLIASCYQESGDIYLSLNKLDSAKYTYVRALDEIKLDVNAENNVKGYIYNGLGNVYFKNGNSKKALDYYKKSLHVAEKIRDVQLQEQIYTSLKKYYSQTKDIKNYEIYSEKYLSILKQEKLSTTKIANKVVESVENENKKANSIIKFLAIISGLLAVLSAGVYTYYLRKSKKFYEVVDNKRKESKIKELVELATKDPQVFHKEFDNHFSFFSKKLLERSPELTLTDIDTCHFMYFNFSTKEIATFTKNSVGAVETRKHRIRKKLDFKGDKDLILWMINTI